MIQTWKSKNTIVNLIHKIPNLCKNSLRLLYNNYNSIVPLSIDYPSSARLKSLNLARIAFAFGYTVRTQSYASNHRVITSQLIAA